MLKIKQYLCKHKFEILSSKKDTQQNLWQCAKCKVYCIQHYGIGVSYKSNSPHFDDCDYENIR